MRKRVRLAALTTAALLMCMALSGLLELRVWAATSDPLIKATIEVESFARSSGNASAAITSNTVVDMVVVYRFDNSVFGYTGTSTGSQSGTSIPFGGGIKSTSDTKIKFNITEDPDDPNQAYMRIDIEKATYTGLPKKLTINKDMSIKMDNGPAYSLKAGDVDVSIPEDFFSGGSGGGSTTTGDEDNPYKSDIIIENVYAIDAEGERIDKINKDTPSFSLVIVYADYGLRYVDDNEFSDNSLEVYLTDTGGFSASAGTKGTLKHIASSRNDAPRFRATFRAMTYNGGGGTVTFRSNYDILGYVFNGTGSGTLTSIDDEDEDKLAPLTPHIIVSQYSYGGQPIAAGDDFTLNLSIRNTSADMNLENIVMTIAPYIPENNTGSTSGGLTITSASNTYYIDTLGVGESFSHSIDLRAEASAAVGSHRVEVSFKFQYVDDVNKTRKDGEDNESIAVPVTQIDRFSVDPLTDLPSYLMVGEEGYLVLSFVNRGKSTTYNISGTVIGNMANSGVSVHYGNLEAGKADNLEFEVVTYEPGMMQGEIVLQYEDENTNEQELRIPFSVEVEAYPEVDMEYPGGDGEWGMEEEEPGVPTATVVLCIIGGILVAIPTALYLYKRIRAKGIEDLDEDF